jgi:hypothetical protein
VIDRKPQGLERNHILDPREVDSDALELRAEAGKRAGRIANNAQGSWSSRF